MDVTIKTDPKFEAKLNAYPDDVKKQMIELRQLIVETARELPEVKKLEECLKWGEPSFVTKTGSTLRMDWKAKTPEYYQLYFKCTSKLVETFKKVFGDLFEYEDNRAIRFTVGEKVPQSAVKQCIQATLLYHRVKQDPTLGMDGL